jgi:hypothetical protein
MRFTLFPNVTVCTQISAQVILLVLNLRQRNRHKHRHTCRHRHKHRHTCRHRHKHRHTCRHRHRLRHRHTCSEPITIIYFLISNGKVVPLHTTKVYWGRRSIASLFCRRVDTSNTCYIISGTRTSGSLWMWYWLGHLTGIEVSERRTPNRGPSKPWHIKYTKHTILPRLLCPRKK